jgi:hypothetical protein
MRLFFGKVSQAPNGNIHILEGEGWNAIYNITILNYTDNGQPNFNRSNVTLDRGSDWIVAENGTIHSFALRDDGIVNHYNVNSLFYSKISTSGEKLIRGRRIINKSKELNGVSNNIKAYWNSEGFIDLIATDGISNLIYAKYIPGDGSVINTHYLEREEQGESPPHIGGLEFFVDSKNNLHVMYDRIGGFFSNSKELIYWKRQSGHWEMSQIYSTSDTIGSVDIGVNSDDVPMVVYNLYPRDEYIPFDKDYPIFYQKGNDHAPILLEALYFSSSCIIGGIFGSLYWKKGMQKSDAVRSLEKKTIDIHLKYTAIITTGILVYIILTWIPIPLIPPTENILRLLMLLQISFLAMLIPTIIISIIDEKSSKKNEDDEESS